MRERKQIALASQEEILLYTLTGEALWRIQLVEQALSHAITLKLNPEETIEKADMVLKTYQSYTLGKAIKKAIEKGLYEPTLQNDLNDFLVQRNWFIHKMYSEVFEDINSVSKREKLFAELYQKVKSITIKAAKIQRSIEEDMIEFCKSKGRDMFEVVELLRLHDQGIRIFKE
jgi:hypothetical protein